MLRRRSRGPDGAAHGPSAGGFDSRSATCPGRRLRDTFVTVRCGGLRAPLSGKLLIVRFSPIQAGFRLSEPGYGAKDITVLEGLEAVRKRPGMYIGSTGLRGLHHLVYEVVDNSVDEALAGPLRPHHRHLAPDGPVTVIDNGRGIPVAVMDGHRAAGGRGRPDQAARRRQVRRRRLQGLGRPARRRRLGRERALASRSTSRSAATATCGGRASSAATRRRRSTKGEPATEHRHDHHLPARRRHLRGRPTSTFDMLAQRAARDGVPDPRPAHRADRRARRRRAAPTSSFEGGIADFVAPHQRRQGPRPQGHRLLRERDRRGRRSRSRCSGTARYVESTFSFANNINTHEGGTHLSGFRAALTRTINDYARAKGLLKEKDEPLTGDDCREGLAAIVSVKLREPQFEGQTKTKLGNPSIRGLVETSCNAKLAEFLEEHPDRGAGDRQQAHRRQPRPPGGAQGARPDPAQDGARRRRPARQAGRLLRSSDPRAARALPRRGRLRRRLRRRRARPRVPGDPAAARQDHQRREGAHQQGALERRDPGHDHGDRHRHRRGVRHRPRPATTRSCVTCDADVDGAHIRTLILTFLFRHMQRADRGGLRLHRPAAALPAQARAPTTRYFEKEPSSRSG